MATGTAAVRPGLGSIANPANTRYSWFCCCFAFCNCLILKRILARLTEVWVSRWEWFFYVLESGLWSQMVVTRVDLIWFMVVLQYFDDSRWFSPHNAAVSHFSSTVVVHWVHRASRRTQSDTALHKKNPETVPWLSQDLEASDLPCLEA